MPVVLDPDELEGCDCHPAGKSPGWRLICWARALSLATVPPPAVEEGEEEEAFVDEGPELLLPHADPATARARATREITIRRIDHPPLTRMTSGQHIEEVAYL
ncbi:MAG TPA: hypothetical protein VG228_06645 [Solirubrobacteraceae bacterium]|nr:hypothetical protein [Solirubrobacteraceae bacterium]